MVCKRRRIEGQRGLESMKMIDEDLKWLGSRISTRNANFGFKIVLIKNLSET